MYLAMKLYEEETYFYVKKIYVAGNNGIQFPSASELEKIVNVPCYEIIWRGNIFLCKKIMLLETIEYTLSN